MSKKAQPARTMDALSALCKRRGFIFPSSEIYGGLNGFWDYGPLGIQLKNNLRDAWWRTMVLSPPLGPDGVPLQIVGLDSSIIQNPRTWVASGHVAGFNDPMVDCRACKARFRADQLQEYACAKKPSKKPGEHDLCDLTEPKDFNLMFETFVGAVQNDDSRAYLRPETAQGIFLNFKNIVDTMRVKVPFGIAQIGKAFRNEVTPRNNNKNQFKKNNYSDQHVGGPMDEAEGAFGSKMDLPGLKFQPDTTDFDYISVVQTNIVHRPPINGCTGSGFHVGQVHPAGTMFDADVFESDVFVVGQPQVTMLTPTDDQHPIPDGHPFTLF